jgi:hypothetical protein
VSGVGGQITETRRLRDLGIEELILIYIPEFLSYVDFQSEIGIPKSKDADT